jgi:polysaccharide biosynthesis protein PslH
MRSVVVARYVPSPPNSGDKQRTLAVVRALAQFGEVTLCAFAGPDEDVESLRREGVRVRAVPVRRGIRQLLGGLVAGRSLTAARFWDERLAHQVAEAVAEGQCDVLVLEHVQSTMYAPAGDQAQVRVIDMHNIESALAERVGRSQRGPRRWIWALEVRLLRRLERSLRSDDVVAVVSRGDREALARFLPAREIVVSPNGWSSPEPLDAPTGPPTVNFVALLSWTPNVAAATWFAEQVWPHVARELPEARLQLVGRNPSERVRDLAQDPSVCVSGTVPDITPWYASSSVCVAPLLAGGGSRLKILEALALGRPVVATRIGVEGLEDLIGRGVIVADDPIAMAAEVVALLKDPARTRALGLAGARAVATSHTWSATLEPLIAAIRATGKAS